MWILVFALLPCVCVLQCFKYLTLRSCLIYSLPYSLVCVLKIPISVFQNLSPKIVVGFIV